MTETEQRIAIAEACGWKWCRVTEPDYTSLWQLTKRYEKSGVLSPGTYFSVRYEVTEQTPPLSQISDRAFADSVPDYLNDLNAMSDVVNSLSLDDRLLWLHWMDVVTSDPNDKKDQAWFPLRVAAAKSDKWAEAFLRAIGKWKD